MILPEGLETIGNCAFLNAKSLTVCAFPESLVTIGEYAFQNCVSLEGEVNIPAKVKTIGKYAFDTCKSITSVKTNLNSSSEWVGTDKVPFSATMGEGAFRNCVSLEGFTLAGSMRTLQDYAFQNCTALREFMVPEGVTSLGNYLFQGCSALKTLTLSEGVTYLGYYFLTGTAVEKLTIPSTVTESGVYDHWSNSVHYYDGALAGAGVTELTFAEGTKKVPASICRSDSQGSVLETVTVPDGVQSIGNYAFCNCTGLKTASVPSSVTAIGTDAFKNCPNLTIFCEADSEIERYAQENGIRVSNRLAPADPEAVGVDFFYQVPEYRHGYCAFNSEIEFVLKTEQAESALLRVDYQNGAGSQKTELNMTYDAYASCYRASMTVAEGTVSLDAVQVTLRRSSGNEVRKLENTKWYPMPLQVEGTATLKLGDRLQDYTGMELRLYEENGRLAATFDLGDKAELTVHGLISQRKVQAVLYGAGQEFARTEYISILPGQNVDIDLSVLPKTAALQLRFVCDGKEITDPGFKGVFFDRTEGKDRLLPSGTSLNYLSAGDTIGWNVVMSRELALCYTAEDGREVTLTAGDNTVSVELTRIPEFTWTCSIKDTGTGLAVFNALVTVTQHINGGYTLNQSVRSGRDGSFSLKLKDVPSTVTVSKNKYSTLNLEVAAGSFPEELTISESGGRIQMLVSYLAAIAEDSSEGAVSSEGLPNAVSVRNGGVQIAAYQNSYPMLYVDEKCMKPGDIITAVVSRKGYADMTLSGTVNEFGNVTLQGVMLEKGGIRVAYTREDNKTDPVHGMLFDAAGNRVAYYQSLEQGQVLTRLTAGSCTLALAVQSEPVNMYADLKSLEASGLKYVLCPTRVSDGVIACPDTVTVPSKTEGISIISGASRLTGKTTVRPGEVLWLSAEVAFGKGYESLEKTLSISLPAGTQLVSNGLSFNGTALSNEAEGGEIKVSVAAGGVLKAGIRVLSSVQASRLNFTASLNYTLDGTAYTQIAGSLDVDVRAVTLMVPARTNETVIVARGIAPSSSLVKIYDNGVLAAETVASRYGAYRAEVTLDTETGRSTHNLYAEAQGEESAVSQLRYGTGYPTVIDFNMYHDAHVSGGTEININTTKEVGSFVGYMWPSKPFDFWVKFDNNQGVSLVSVYIEFTNGEHMSVPLTYNPQTDYYEGSVTLSSRTVPKTLNVSYLPTLFYDEENTEGFTLFGEMSSAFLEGEKSDDGFYAESRFTRDEIDGQVLLHYIESKNSVEFTPTKEFTAVETDDGTMYIKLEPTYIETDIGVYETLEMYFPNGDGTFMYIQRGFGNELEKDDSGELASLMASKMTRKEAEEKLQNYRNSFKNVTVTDENRAEVIQKLADFSRICSENENMNAAMKTKLDIIKTKTDTAELMHNTNATLEMFENMDDYYGLFSNMFAGDWTTIITEETMTKLADKKVMNKLKKQGNDAINQTLQEIMDSIANDPELWEMLEEDFMDKMTDMNLIMDPSGYVYETSTENRLSGVTATLYFRNENGEMEQWDAEEFNQVNPQLTDENGSYAWDVPEGEWQVLFEKEGYVPAQSKVLPVPPPQTEVNIQMTSRGPAAISSAECRNNRITVSFDRYLDADTITAGCFTLKDEDGVWAAEIDLSGAVTLPDGMTVIKDVLLLPVKTLPEGDYTVSMTGSVSTYAGVPAGQSSGEFHVSETVEPESGYVITDLSLEAGKVTVQLTCGMAEASVYVAVYDSQGRFLTCKSVPVELEPESSGPVTISLDTTGAARATAFVVDKNMRPLCAAKSSD